MRRIGSLNDHQQAERFSEYLLTQSIHCNVDASADSDGSGQVYDLWIRDEEKVEQAKSELELFRASPEDSKYRVSGDAERIRQEQAAEEKRRRSYLQKVQHRSNVPGVLAGVSIKQQSIPVTIGMIVICVVTFFISGQGQSFARNMSDEVSSEQRVYDALVLVTRKAFFETGDPYAEIRQGQIWRIVTPMFLHGSMFHLAFNMLGIFFLGSVLERLNGSVFFAVLLVIGVAVGNLVQINLPTADKLPEILHGLSFSPFVVGASGGLYALFGYVWIRPAISPSFPVHLPQSSVTMLLLWIPISMFFFPRIANGAHIGGLIAGMLIAVAMAQLENGRTA